MKIGWIGAGIMGGPMVGHLLKAGYPVYLYARHPEKVAKWVEQGAHLCSSIEDLTRCSNLIATMVGFPQDVESVYRSIFTASRPGQICIDFTTSDPHLAQELYTKGKRVGLEVFDAPVTGGDVGAQKGELTILVGGSETGFHRIRPVLTAFGSSIHYCGQAGSGQRVKMANQIMIANTLMGICEAMAYLQDADMDPDLIYKYLRDGAAGSKQLDLQGQKMMTKDYRPGFMVQHFLKDLRIAQSSAKRDLDGLNHSLSIYQTLMEKGYAQSGTQSIWDLYDKNPSK